VSEYGKRAVPVAAKVLSSEVLERWRNRERNLLSHGALAAAPDSAAAESPVTVPRPTVAADPAQQRSRAKRQRTLIGAKVVFNDLMSVYDCTIRDLSDSGARVKLNAPVQIPPSFMLRFSDGRIRRCKVRRRNALELGIEFLD
jgi:hypothetical protein